MAMLWGYIIKLADTKLLMSTSDHPQTDCQTERMKRVVEDILRSYVSSYDNWVDHLPMVEFAMNNAPSTSTRYTPFYVINLRYPRLPASLGGVTNFGREDPRLSHRVMRIKVILNQIGGGMIDLSTVDYQVNHLPMESLVDSRMKAKEILSDCIWTRQSVVCFVTL